jgi:chemotaxis protein methyltransferase CheR
MSLGEESERPPTEGSATEALEIKLLLEALYSHYGYDFRNYSYPSIRRRILRSVALEELESISALQARVLRDPDCVERLLQALTIHVTSMFRDPTFYASFRKNVVPLLRTYPFLRFWHAGCSTGEEVYSMAILLHEEGLLQRCRIYATDISDRVLRMARSGIVRLTNMKENTDNYLSAGGKQAFSEYYTADAENVIFRPFLREKLVFSMHNLVTDGSINEFNAIICRNVLIYFDDTLQERAHGLFYNSLVRLGVLSLGKKESIRFTPHEASYEEIDRSEKIYRKVT